MLGTIGSACSAYVASIVLLVAGMSPHIARSEAIRALEVFGVVVWHELTCQKITGSSMPILKKKAPVISDHKLRFTRYKTNILANKKIPIILLLSINNHSFSIKKPKK